MFFCSLRARWALAGVLIAALFGQAPAQQPQSAGVTRAVPRTADGKPDLQGIWQARGAEARALQSRAAEAVPVSALGGGKTAGKFS